MSDLCVMDVSALVHTGNTSKYYQDRMYYGYPVGGLHYLMKYVTMSLAKRDSVILCFDSQSFRVDLDPGYKAGRVKNASVISQIETAYEALSACGIRCEKYDGYEADDIIDWACQQYAGKYGSVDIVGNDIDLCHSVQNGVRFESIRSGENIVYYGNFEIALVPGERIRFNTISAYKTFVGCKSDHVLAMHLKSGIAGRRLYDEFLKFVDATYPNATYRLLTDWRLPVSFAVDSGLFDEEEKNEVYKRAKIIYPAPKPDGVEIKPTVWSDINIAKLAEFLVMYGDRDSLACVSERKPQITEEQKEEVRRKARELQTGEYAADNNTELSSRARTPVTSLTSFTREF